MNVMNTDYKGLAYIRSEEEFSRAHRKAFLQDFTGRIRGHSLNLLSFDEVVDKLRLRDAVNLGLKEILLKQIVGSCGRYTDFTRTFFPRRAGRDKERWRQIYTLVTTGKGFPPIDVYKIDQVYFVKDGNHRVSVARELNWESIQACVTELPTVFTLDANVGPDQLLIKEECAIFLERTGLHKLRPEANIVYTTPGRYRRLLKQISIHDYVLSQQEGKDIPYSEVVADWYDNVYQPMVDHVKQTGIMKRFPNRTADDLIAWLISHQKRLQRSHKMDDGGYVESVDDFLAYIDELKPWDVARAGVEDKIRGLFGKEENEDLQA